MGGTGGPRCDSRSFGRLGSSFSCPWTVGDGRSWDEWMDGDVIDALETTDGTSSSTEDGRR